MLTPEQAARMYENRCIECGEPNPTENVGRLFCGGACKQRDYRRRKRAEQAQAR